MSLLPRITPEAADPPAFPGLAVRLRLKRRGQARLPRAGFLPSPGLRARVRAGHRRGHDCKGNCDHLIRRDLYDHVTPGQTAADLARLRSLVRVGSRRCALS